tara:strand:- start:8 stop:280 length:273 start_codon:yes stop_codon:yes gene_type:complete
MSDTDFIDEFFDNKEDPKLDHSENCSFVGYMETLIYNSLFDDSTKEKFYAKLLEIRESEIELFLLRLKRNQQLRDPKDQYKKMVKDGLFN